MIMPGGSLGRALHHLSNDNMKEEYNAFLKSPLAVGEIRITWD